VTLLAAGGTVFAQPVLPNSLQWLILIAGAAFAAQRIWTLIMRPLARIVSLLDRALPAFPVLEQIAQEFTPNDGGSLHDVIHRIDRRLAQVESRINTLDEQVNPPPVPSDLRKAIRDAVIEVLPPEMLDDNEDASSY